MNCLHGLELTIELVKQIPFLRHLKCIIRVYMAQKKVFGVGIGNWGFAYAKYRKYRPRFLFGKRVQVRRAHGDHAQMLAETGWPGLAFFIAMLSDYCIEMPYHKFAFFTVVAILHARWQGVLLPSRVARAKGSG